MLKNHLIIFPSNEPKNAICDYLYQTAAILSRKNKVIVVLTEESISLKSYFIGKQHDVFYYENGIWYIKPLLFIPFSRHFWAKRSAIVFWISLLTFSGIFLKQRVVIWNFFPDLSVYIGYFSQKNSHIHFDIVDYYFSLNKDRYAQISQNKKYQLKISDSISAISNVLSRGYQLIRCSEINVVAQGFSKEIFNLKKKIKLDIPKDKPIVGYIGGINQRINYELLKKVINRKPGINFIAIGPVSFDSNISLKEDLAGFHSLLKYPNFFWFDRQPKEDIPEIISLFDIAMIPYVSTHVFNFYSYPMKVLEYFYLGKPVLSTRIKSLEQFGRFIFCSDEVEFWCSKIDYLLKLGWSEKYKKDQRKIAINNSWEVKIEQISKQIERLAK